VSRVAGSQMVFEAMPDHPFRPVSGFKRLILKLITDDASKMAGMQTGDIDLSVISLDEIPQAQSAGLQLSYIPAMTMATVGFWDTWDTRSKGKPTSDVNVRKALSMAINADELISTIWAGHATKAEGNVPNLWPSDAAPFTRSAIPFDPAQAQQLLQQAGFTSGFDIKLYTFPFAGVPWLGKLAEAVAGYWNRIGVNTQIVSTDFASMTQLFNTQVPSDQLLGNAYTVPYFWIANVATWNANQYSGNTASGFRNILDPTLTNTFRTAVAARDDNARVAALRQGAQIIYDTYTIPAYALVDTAIASGKRVSSVSPQPQVNFLSMWFNSVGQA
jgi:peptide/nickel transport system substrate-binding protein